MSQQENYKIALNFFRLQEQNFEFTVYRRLAARGESREDHPGAISRKLPAEEWKAENSYHEPPPYQQYWVSYSEREDFDPFLCTARSNNYLTIDYLYHLLKQKCFALSEDEYFLDEDRFTSRIVFILKAHPEGREVVWIQPYLLRTVGEFGFLADFKFDAQHEEKQSSRVLELSLALKNGHPNKDFYADRFSKLQRFVSMYHDRIGRLDTGPSKISLEKTLRELEAKSLHSKTYEFADATTSKSQFVGIKDNGPLQPVDDNVKFYFVYRPYDKPLSYDLYHALRGDTFQTFPGMEEMFGLKMGRERVGGVPTDGFDQANLEKVCEAIESETYGKRVVPVLITPFKKGGQEEENDAYYLAKYTFLKRGWASQFVSLATLRNKNSLKWSASSIGLQLFAKMGGQPWKVQPKRERSLIVGLGQAHHVASGVVKKYFAYSVLTDSSGLYEDIRVLGSSPSETNYVREFKSRLREVFEEFGDRYERFVIHASFKIQKRELDAVKEVLTGMRSEGQESEQDDKFVVIKFNDKNRFFGYSRASNSLVPYESSFVPLSRSEYLVWFEGLQRHNPNISKRIERPLHVEFLYPEEGLDAEQREQFLQDAVNLSGTNWRGFNAKSLPVSVYYAKIVASYFKEFQARNLPDIDLKTISPWFL